MDAIHAPRRYDDDDDANYQRHHHRNNHSSSGSISSSNRHKRKRASSCSTTTAAAATTTATARTPRSCVSRCLTLLLVLVGSTTTTTTRTTTTTTTSSSVAYAFQPQQPQPLRQQQQRRRQRRQQHSSSSTSSSSALYIAYPRYGFATTATRAPATPRAASGEKEARKGTAAERTAAAQEHRRYAHDRSERTVRPLSAVVAPSSSSVGEAAAEVVSSSAMGDTATTATDRNWLEREGGGEYDENAFVAQRRQPSPSVSSFWGPALGAAMLITGNTVGASCLVLPQVVEGPGFLPGCGLFLAAYLFNWYSGTALADVAIRQYEDQQQEQLEQQQDPSPPSAPSSFKELASANLNSPAAANLISAVSLFLNTCVLSFDLTRAGAIGERILSVPIVTHETVTIAWASMLASLVLTQSTSTLSRIASVLVAALFVSFGSVLVPGVAAVRDPVATVIAPGTATTIGDGSGTLLDPSWLGSLGHAAPILLMTLVYQNVVPSVTKLLEYDRAKVRTAITVGSLLPLGLFVSFCYAGLGGGIDYQSLVDGGGGASWLLTLFSCTTLAGSSLGSVLSLSEEVDTYIGNGINKSNNRNADVEGDDKQQTSDVGSAVGSGSGSGFAFQSVAVGVALPLLASIAFANGDDITVALQLAGGIGTPLLYGVLPAVMAYNNHRDRRVARAEGSRTGRSEKATPSVGDVFARQEQQQLQGQGEGGIDFPNAGFPKLPRFALPAVGAAAAAATVTSTSGIFNPLSAAATTAAAAASSSSSAGVVPDIDPGFVQSMGEQIIHSPIGTQVATLASSLFL